MDYFEARYFRASDGRFSTTDPVMTAVKNLAAPQRWNRYTYALSNPLRYLDPNGEDSFAVFLNFTQADLSRRDGGVQRPDWNGIKAAAEANGHTVSIIPAGSVADFQRAVSTPGMNVLDVGHSVLRPDSNQTEAVGIELGGSAAGGIGDPGYSNNGQTLTAASDVQASSVNIFSCNSSTLASQYTGAQVFTGVDSGANLTNSITLEAAGASFLQAATSTRTPNLATAAAAAQATIDGSQILTPSATGRSRNIDTGDRVVQQVRRK
jgi:RHS repeat-associated protein